MVVIVVNNIKLRRIDGITNKAISNATVVSLAKL